jgi:hypothetical protein
MYPDNLRMCIKGVDSLRLTHSQNSDMSKTSAVLQSVIPQATSNDNIASFQRAFARRDNPASEGIRYIVAENDPEVRHDEIVPPFIAALLDGVRFQCVYRIRGLNEADVLFVCKDTDGEDVCIRAFVNSTPEKVSKGNLDMTRNRAFMTGYQFHIWLDFFWPETH